VTQHICRQLDIPVQGVLTGNDVAALDDHSLAVRAELVNLFCRVNPAQKNRVIMALKSRGHVAGYLGDGINDAPSLHSADVGLSVDSAVDVAKEAADMILLEHDLGVVHEGVLEGRRTFGNIMKYIMMGTSSNFGNMFSMAGASLFLPFLPLLAKQILLNNFLSDFPGMTLASDNVDAELVERPRRWDVKFIRDFMVLFGLVSSVFDYLTFGVLLLVVRAAPTEFRTAWFIESLLTELVIALVVRTRQPFYRSRPGRWLLVSTLLVALLTLALPYLPVNYLFDFTPLPLPVLLVLLLITALYVAASEIAKKFFYAHAR